MAKNKLEEWDETAANNTDVGGINLGEGMLPSDVNNAERESMAQLAKWLGDDTISSATTTDLGSVPARAVTVTGTTTITGLGTIKAGTIKFVTFSGILTLTHNGTSLILPGAANITTAAGDTAVLVSLGSGNWRCMAYQRAALAPVSFAPIWEPIGTRQNITTSTANVSWTNLSAYRDLRLTWWARPVIDGASPFLQVSTNNGSSYISTGYTRQYVNYSGSFVSAQRNLDMFGLALSGPTGNSGDERAFGTTEVIEFSTAGNGLSCITSGGYYDDTTTWQKRDTSAWYSSASARNALRFVFDSGNIALGSFLLEGVRG